MLLFSVVCFAQVSKIDAVYRDIHDEVCAGMNVTPCPRLDNEMDRWAFVTTWCKRNPSAACDPIKDLTGGPVVIAFNHRTKEWRAIYGVPDANVDEVKGTPNVLVSSGADVVAVVEGTNPLLYTAEAGAITETDSKAITALKALFEGLGPSIVKAMGLAEKPLTPDEGAAIKDVEDAIKALQCVTEQTDSAVSFIRTVESGGNGQYKLLKSSCTVTDEASLKTAFKNLEDSLEPLRMMDFCATSANSLITLLDTPASSSKKLRENIDAVAIPPRCTTFRNPNPPPARTTSPLQELAQRVIARAEAILKAEADLAAATTAADKAAAKAALAAARKDWNDTAQGDITTLTRRKNAATAATALATAAGELLKKGDDLKAALRKINEFEQRLMESAATPATKAPADPFTRTEIADFFVVPHGGIPVAFEKNRSRTLKVKESSPYAAVIDAKADVDTSYTASVLAASLFDMSVAVTHTQLASPVFGVVSEPAPTATDPNAKKNVIAKKDEEERSGKLAVFVSYPVLSIFAPNRRGARAIDLDLGVGTGTDTPAFFLGASWRIGPIRIGGGSTWQQVKALDGQSIGDTVASKDDIKLKNELDSSWYAAFSFSLGEALSLFKK